MPGQFGEENAIRALFPAGYKGFAVDVGACDGIFLNTTYELEQEGWEVLCIEPNPYWIPALTTNRKNVMQLACSHDNREAEEFTIFTMGPEQGPWAACSGLYPDKAQISRHETLIRRQEVIKVKVRTLNWCLEQMGWNHVDFLTVDTEGNDWNVLRGFDFDKYQPKMIICENWYEDGMFVSWVEDKGYQKILRQEVNDIYVRL